MAGCCIVGEPSCLWQVIARPLDGSTYAKRSSGLMYLGVVLVLLPWTASLQVVCDVLLDQTMGGSSLKHVNRRSMWRFHMEVGPIRVAFMNGRLLPVDLLFWPLHMVDTPPRATVRECDQDVLVLHQPIVGGVTVYGVLPVLRVCAVRFAALLQLPALYVQARQTLTRVGMVTPAPCHKAAVLVEQRRSGSAVMCLCVCALPLRWHRTA